MKDQKLTLVSLLLSMQATTRAVKLLDLIPPYNTHKIGVVYVGKEQVSKGLDLHTSCPVLLLRPVKQPSWLTHLDLAASKSFCLVWAS